MLKFALIIIAIYSCIVYLVSITVGLYAGMMTLVLLLVILPIIVPKERRITKFEEEALGKMKVNFGKN
jgi:hypothetical protein